MSSVVKSFTNKIEFLMPVVSNMLITVIFLFLKATATTSATSTSSSSEKPSTTTTTSTNPPLKPIQPKGRVDT